MTSLRVLLAQPWLFSQAHPTRMLVVDVVDVQVRDGYTAD